MRVLTIRQPWAGAIFARGKDVENRSWPTQYRGPLIIHAGGTFARSPDAQRIAVDDAPIWTRGAVLGTVELVDCVRGHRSRWADADAWHWVLRAPRALCQKALDATHGTRGKLGLWHPDARIRMWVAA